MVSVLPLPAVTGQSVFQMVLTDLQGDDCEPLSGYSTEREDNKRTHRFTTTGPNGPHKVTIIVEPEE